MLDRTVFERRFITHMTEIVGKDDSAFYAELADSSYELYIEDPEDMTPEEHAEEEIQEWGR